MSSGDPKAWEKWKSNSSSLQIKQGPCLLVLSHWLRPVPFVDSPRKMTQNTQSQAPNLRKALIHQGVLQSWNFGIGGTPLPSLPRANLLLKKKRKKKKEKSRTFPNKVMPHAICGFKLLSTPGACDIQGSHPFTLMQGSPRRMRKSLWCVSGDYKWLGNMLCRWNPTFSWLTTLEARRSTLLPAWLSWAGPRHREGSWVALHARLLSPTRYKLLEGRNAPFFLLFHPAMLITA